MALVSLGSPRRIAALLVVGLMVLAPAVWVFWSLAEASAMSEANSDQAATLASLQARLKVLSVGAQGNQANVASVYLPGKSQAIAGAALQRLVASAVEGAGGRMVQSEIVSAQTEDQPPGIVNLRAAFDTDIVGLQHVIFELETGAPILMVQTLTVETAKTDADADNPKLSVIVQLQGHWET